MIFFLSLFFLLFFFHIDRRVKNRCSMYFSMDDPCYPFASCFKLFYSDVYRFFVELFIRLFCELENFSQRRGCRYWSNRVEEVCSTRNFISWIMRNDIYPLLFGSCFVNLICCVRLIFPFSYSFRFLSYFFSCRGKSNCRKIWEHTICLRVIIQQ